MDSNNKCDDDNHNEKEEEENNADGHGYTTRARKKEFSGDIGIQNNSLSSPARQFLQLLAVDKEIHVYFGGPATDRHTMRQETASRNWAAQEVREGR